MRTFTKPAALILAATFALTPITAHAVGDGMFNWPSELNTKKVEQSQNVDSGATFGLKAVLQSKRKDKTENSQ